MQQVFEKWAECLSKIEENGSNDSNNDSKWLRLSRLIYFCPNLPSNINTNEKIDNIYYENVIKLCKSNNIEIVSGVYPMDERSGNALLSLVYYIEKSNNNNNNKYLEIIVNLLLAYIVKLPYFKWKHKSRKEEYTRSLISSILIVADKYANFKVLILNALKKCVKLYSNYRRHLAGLLSSLKKYDYLISDDKDWKRLLLQLLKQFPPNKKPKYAAFCISLLRQVVMYLDENEEHNVWCNYVSVIIKHSNTLDTVVSYKRREERLELLIETLKLSAVFTIHHEKWKNDVLKLSTALLGHSIDKGSQGDLWNGWIEICKSSLDTMIDICVKYSDMIHTVVNNLKGILLYSRRLLRHAHSKDMREIITESLATLLKTDLQLNEQYAISLTRKVIFSLLNSLYKELESNKTSKINTSNNNSPNKIDHNIEPPSTPIAFGNRRASSLDTEQLSIEQIQQHALQLVGSLTHLLCNTMITKESLPVITERFLEKPKSLHLVVPHLVSIAFSGGNDLPFFNETLQLLITTYHRPNSPDNKHNIREISDAFLQMSERLVGGGEDHVHKWRYIFLRSILKMFCELGTEINEHAQSESKTNSETSMVGILGVLLPTLAILMIQVDSNENDYELDRNLYCDLDRYDSKCINGINVFANTDNNVSWFIRLWFLFILYNFSSVDEPIWPSDWLLAVCHVAKNSPVLVSRSSNRSFIGGLDTVVTRLCIGKNRLLQLRKRLNNKFTSLANNISNISDSSCLYCLSIYELEHLRVKTRVDGYFYGIFEYLSSDSLDDANISVVIEAIADKIFNEFLEYINELEELPNLELQAKFLISKLTNRFQRVRAKAASYLNLLAGRYKYLQWSESCLITLLNSINLIHKTIQQDEGLSKTMNQLSARHNVRSEIEKNLEQLAISWIKNAKYLVPTRIDSVLQNFVIRTSPSHVAISLIFDISTTKITRLLCGTTMKERFLGEISGLALTMGKDDLIVRLTRNISSVLTKFHTQENINEAEDQLERLIYQCAAVLIWYNNNNTNSNNNENNNNSTNNNKNNENNYFNNENNHFKNLENKSNSDQTNSSVDAREILHLIVKVPVKIFSKRAMKAAVFVWEWIFSTCIDQQLPLLMEIKAAWAYSVDRNKGLFSNQLNNTENSREYALIHDLKEPIHDDPNKFEPHSLWIQFLFDRFIPVTGYTPELLNALTMMLHKAFAKPELLSYERNAFSARFQLILLGLKVLQQNTVQLEVRDRRLLRGRLYHSAFQWFFIKPYWIDPEKSVTMIQSNIRLVNEVCKALQLEDQYWNEQDQNTSTNVLNKNENSNTERSIRRSVSKNYHPRSKSTQYGAIIYEDSTQISTSRTRSATIMLSEGQTLSEDSVSIVMNLNHSETEKKERLLSVRSLLLFLMCHESDRLSIWYNPTEISSKQSKDEQLYTTRRHVSGREWRAFMKTAWLVDSRLAVRLAQRFPMIKHLNDTLRSLILENPEAVYHIPDAVMYLINTKNNEQQLQHLIYWAPCSLHIALKLLAPPYVDNRAINEYAVHSLRCHSFDEVMFYLPQLIQSLRHDECKLLRSYMVEAAQSSILLAHQLVWMCEAELGTENENVVIDYADPHRASIQKLIQDIIQSFGQNEADYFKAEFTFFEKITSISGVLKPLEVVGDRNATKELRKIKIREELEKIPISASSQLYIPTNPYCEIVSIITKSGTPMQSAAKVPILVAFQCRKTTIEKRCPESIDQLRSYLKELEYDQKNDGSETKNNIMIDGHVEENDLNAPLLDMPELMIDIDDDIDVNNKNGNQNDRTESKDYENDHDQINDNTSSHISIDTSWKDTKKNINESKLIIDNSQLFSQACIFKVGDDVRQDALALQIIRLCKRIWQSVGLDLFVYPYSVLPNRIGNLIGGVIECVPNAQTRDEIGKATACSLKDHFIITFGREESPEYQTAQRNFILSLAGYAIVSYLLQAKDRHNGNLMIDDKGRVIHIDFGFIFDISPGHDMKFERAGFKLTLEMVEIMDGSSDQPLYKWFTELIIRGFLAVREHQEEIIALVSTMTKSDLACFKPHSIENLRNRFFPDRDERSAAQSMQNIISEAYNNFRTNMYDYIQNMQQNIYYWRGNN